MRSSCGKRHKLMVLAIPILCKHMSFLLENHRRFHSGEEPEPKPAALGDMFSTSWTILNTQQVLGKGTFHISQVSIYNHPPKHYEENSLHVELQIV